MPSSCAQRDFLADVDLEGEYNDMARPSSIRILADVNVTLHDVVAWTPLVSLPMTHGWKNTSVTETFGTDSDDVSV